MRLLYVVQRYGAEVAGGAEAHCREFATRMAARGHDVEVLTTCALRYSDWRNDLPPGTSEDAGVTVHRLPVARPRERAVFDHLTARVTTAERVDLALEREWVRLQGPFTPDVVPWLERRAAGYDAVVFVTYLYFTTWAGVQAAAGRVPLLLHPTAHDEPYLWLRAYDPVWRAVDGFVFLTEEEQALVRRRAGPEAAPGGVVGVGVEPGAGGDAAGFRAERGLGDRPYLLYVGRYDVGKASDEMVRWFTAVKERSPGPLALVLLGDPVIEPPEHPDVVVTGFVDEATKHAALAGARALVQPSYLESFSIALAEAWAHGRPALVQGRSDVLAGQVRRSGGGIPYHDFAEFEAAVELVAGDPDLAEALGARGRAYVEEHYRWEQVLDRYEDLVERTVRAPWGRRWRTPARPPVGRG